MADTHYIRLFVSGTNLTFGWREPLKAQKAYEELEALRRRWSLPTELMAKLIEREFERTPDGRIDSPIFEITDEFGQHAGIDVRECKAVICTSTQQASELNNAIRLGALKGEMHMEKLIKDDAQLNAWVKLRQGHGAVMMPGPGTTQ